MTNKLKEHYYILYIIRLLVYSRKTPSLFDNDGINYCRTFTYLSSSLQLTANEYYFCAASFVTESFYIFAQKICSSFFPARLSA